MGDLKQGFQKSDGTQTNHTPEGTEGANNQGADFGTADRATRGTNRDADTFGESKNEGHGHPREERGRN